MFMGLFLIPWTEGEEIHRLRGNRDGTFFSQGC